MTATTRMFTDSARQACSLTQAEGANKHAVAAYDASVLPMEILPWQKNLPHSLRARRQLAEFDR